jgi:hypothetical protein
MPTFRPQPSGRSLEKLNNRVIPVPQSKQIAEDKWFYCLEHRDVDITKERNMNSLEMLLSSYAGSLAIRK